MLMLYEFKKNIGFFLLMTLVLTLLMSAGVSLFNFSFEINRTVQEDLESDFEFGYGIWTEGAVDPDTKTPGVNYYFYDGNYRLFGIDGIEVDEDFDWAAHTMSMDVYRFEDYLPKIFSAAAKNSGFITDGRLWTSADNSMTDGRYPIFLSQSVVQKAFEKDIDLKAGSFLRLSDFLFEDGVCIEGHSIEFVVTGIYDNSAFYEIPYAVIPVNAEKEYREATGWEINFTYNIINSLSDYKEFSKYAKANGIDYSSHIEEDLALVGLFSAVFASVSITILLLCGAVSYIYCGMYITRRLNFIGLLKAMGLQGKQIAMQFFVLLLIVLGAAFIAGNLFSVVITSHFSNLAITLFEFELNTGFNFISQLIFGALTVLTAFLSVIFIARKIDKIGIAQTLTQKE